MFRLSLTHHQANIFIHKVAIDMQCQISCIYCGNQSLQLARIILICIVKFKCKYYCSKIALKMSLSLMHPLVICYIQLLIRCVVLHVVCCGTMSVLLLSYIYLFSKCSLLFAIRIERGAPASSIRLVVLNSARGIQTRLVVFKFAS